jgi:hypothetical protein
VVFLFVLSKKEEKMEGQEEDRTNGEKKSEDVSSRVKEISWWNGREIKFEEIMDL